MLVVESRKGESVDRTTYNLSGLVLEAGPQPGFEGFISTPDMTAQTCAYPAGFTVDITQSSIALQDNVDGYGTEFTGTISGQVYGYVDTMENTQYRLGFKIEEGLIKTTSQLGFKLYDSNNNEINLGSMMFAGSEMPADGYIAISAGSTNTEVDPEDIKSIVAEYVDYTDTEAVKFITVTYTTNLTKGGGGRVTLSPSTLGAEVQGLPVNSQRGVAVSSDAISGEIFPTNSNVSYQYSDDEPINPSYELCLDVAVDGIENLSNIKIKTSDKDGNFDVLGTSTVFITEAVSSVRIGVADSNGLLKVEYVESGETHTEVYSLSNLTRRKGFVFKNPKTIYDTISGTNPFDAEVGDSGVVNEKTVMHSKAVVNENGTLAYEMSIEGRTGLALDIGGQNTVNKTLFLELTDEFNELNPGMNNYTFIVGNPPPVAYGGITGNVVEIPKTAWNGSRVNMTLSNSTAMTSVRVVIDAEGETLADDIVAPGEDYVSTDITIPTGFTGTVYKFPGGSIRDFNNEAVEVDSVYRIKLLTGEIGSDNKITLPIDPSLVEIQSGAGGYFYTSLWIMDYDGNYYTTSGRVDIADAGFPAITFTVPEGVFNVSDPSRAGIVTFSGRVEQYQGNNSVSSRLSNWLFEGSGYFTKPSA